MCVRSVDEGREGVELKGQNKITIPYVHSLGYKHLYILSLSLYSLTRLCVPCRPNNSVHGIQNIWGKGEEGEL